MATSAIFQRSFAAAESRRHQRALMPIAVAFLGIAVQPFVEAESVTRQASTYIGILVALGCVATQFFDPEPGESSSIDSVYSKYGKWVMRVLVHLICWKYDHEAHSVLLRFASVVVFPLSGARDDDGPLFTAYLVGHFLFTCLHLYTSLASEGWQWLIVLVICDIMLWDMSESSRNQRNGQVLLNKTTQVVQSLLGTICDGCLLLTEDGIIAGADQKATNLLNLSVECIRSLRPDAHAAAAPKIGGVLEGVLEGGQLVRGLRMVQINTGHSPEERLQVEAYIIPCPMSSKDSAILGMNVAADWNSAVRVHLCAFRLADGGLEPMASPMTAPSMGPGKPRPRMPSIGSMPNSSPTRNTSGGPHSMLQESRHGNLIRSEGSVVDSGIGSPRTQMSYMPSSGNLQGQAMAGIPVHALQAVGLGVGSYTKVRVVGKGSQGQVWQVTSQDGTYYAQKECDLKGVLWHRDFPKRLKDADREVRALKGLAWAACVIVPIVDCWIQNDFEMSCIVMEWLPKTLDGVLSKLAKDKSGPVPVSVACNWIARLVAGLGAIHATGFIHRDLKPSNILLDESLQQCKITDLGVSRSLHMTKDAVGAPPMPAYPQPQKHAGGGSVVGSTVSHQEEKYSMVSETMGSMLSGYTVRPGTVAYTSPEANESCHYGPEADIFSLGVVLLEILSLQTPPEPRLGQVPSPSATMDRAMVLLAEPPAGANVSDWNELKRLCLGMVRPDPQKRPSARELAMSRVLLPHVEGLGETCPRLRILLLQGSGEAGIVTKPTRS
mmetsp:Transcript_52086/g.167628  ORF Transcript_52086/g.167628 Transcript_52086/m.167628 type:complete len:777 (+) Transcript_52086:140-2470(+)